MPEMPEVETIRCIIEPQVAGQKKVAVTINNPQVIAYPDECSFQELSIVAGIGNIYSKEILFAAKLYPETKSMDYLRVYGYEGQSCCYCPICQRNRA